MKFIVFGDSHAKQFELNEKVRFHLNIDKQIKLDVNRFRASSIKGLVNPNSTLGVRDSIMNKKIEDVDVVVLGFGQVDVELGYYFLKVVKQSIITFEEFVDGIVAKYIAFINDMQVNFQKPIVVKGINLPVFKFDRFWLNYVSRILDVPEKLSVRKKVLASMWGGYSLLQEKTNTFNGKLENSINDLDGVLYYDVNYCLKNQLHNEIDDRFVPSWFDHHIVDTIEVRSFYINSLLNLKDKL